MQQLAAQAYRQRVPPVAVLDTLRASVRAAGLRATPSRVEVLALLQRVGAPMSHAEAYDRLGPPVADRATVYRNLIDLADVGLLRRTDLGDHVWRFEFVDSAHGNAGAHPHFVCTACGGIECLPDVTVAAGRNAPRAVRQRKVDVQVRGVCDGCG